MSEYLATTDVQQFAPSAASAVKLGAYVGSAWANSAWSTILAAAGATGGLLSSVIYQPAYMSGYGPLVEIDIGAGDAGSEVVIATLRQQYNNSTPDPYSDRRDNNFPILIDAIPPNARIAARWRTSMAFWIGTNYPYVAVGYFNKPITTVLTTTKPPKVCPSTSESVCILTSAADWTNSAWVQLTASTATDWILLGLHANFGTIADVGDYVIELGVGAEGFEAVIARARGTKTGSTNYSPFLIDPYPNPVNAVPVGSRLSARIRGSLDVGENNAAVWVTYLEAPL